MRRTALSRARTEATMLRETLGAVKNERTQFRERIDNQDRELNENAVEMGRLRRKNASLEDEVASLRVALSRAHVALVTVVIGPPQPRAYAQDACAPESPER